MQNDIISLIDISSSLLINFISWICKISIKYEHNSKQDNKLTFQFILFRFNLKHYMCEYIAKYESDNYKQIFN